MAKGKAHAKAWRWNCTMECPGNSAESQTIYQSKERKGSILWENGLGQKGRAYNARVRHVNSLPERGKFTSWGGKVPNETYRKTRRSELEGPQEWTHLAACFFQALGALKDSSHQSTS